MHGVWTRTVRQDAERLTPSPSCPPPGLPCRVPGTGTCDSLPQSCVFQDVMRAGSPGPGLCAPRFASTGRITGTRGHRGLLCVAGAPLCGQTRSLALPAEVSAPPPAVGVARCAGFRSVTSCEAVRDFLRGGASPAALLVARPPPCPISLHLFSSLLVFVISVLLLKPSSEFFHFSFLV